MRYDTWDDFLAAQRRQDYFRKISEFVTAERRRTETWRVPGSADAACLGVYPPSADVFNFTLTPLRSVKVVILGQDPYHQPGQAHGLAFSVPEGVQKPPSLQNIFGELVDDLCGIPDASNEAAMRAYSQAKWQLLPRPRSGDLTPWTRQGVLLLNAALTVRRGQAGSHLKQWQPFTDEVIRAVLDSSDAPVIHFTRWGTPARKTCDRVFGQLLYDPREGVEWGHRASATPFASRCITATSSPHPSPHSADRGFFGSRPFSRANTALAARGVAPVDWRLP